jgi:general secretion pathway protein C
VPEPTATLNQKAIDTIVNRNIFSSEGKAQDGAGAKVDGQLPGEKQVTIVKSDLPISLTGTIYGGDPLSGIALVENTTKKTINSFMVGDSLLKDVTLKEIHKQKIIIDNNGRTEFVELVQEKLSRSRRQKKQAVASTSDSVAPIATEPPPPSFKEEGFERKDRDMTMSQSYRSKLLTADFTKVLQDAKASPNMVDGELKGFVMTRIRKDSIYEKAGLQNDDIVTEVNGVPLTDTAQSIRLLQSLRGESEIEIRIVRGGSPLKFNLNVK